MSNKYIEKIASTRFIREIIKKNPGAEKNEIASKVSEAYKKLHTHNNWGPDGKFKESDKIYTRSTSGGSTVNEARRAISVLK